MKLENQVCSLELAKRLEELGVKQESSFYWHNCKLACPEYEEYNIVPNNWHSAFTVAELGELLPKYIQTETYHMSLMLSIECVDFDESENVLERHIYHVSYFEKSVEIISFKSLKEADARAKMLIYLLENGLIKSEDINR